MNRPVALIASAVLSISLAGCTAASAPATSAGGPTPSSSSTAFSLQQYNDESWERVRSRFPDAVRPEVAFERFVTMDEWPTTRAECLGEQGFEVRIGENGGVGGIVPPEQEETLAVARYTCDVRYPADPQYTTPLDDTQLKLLYSYFTTELAPCLEAEGFVIGRAPSLSVFTDSYYGEQSWSPYNDVLPALANRSLNELTATCPQLPGNLYG